MRRLKELLIAARDNVLIVVAFVFCVCMCVLLVVGLVASVLFAVGGASVIAAWDRVKGRRERK